MNTLDRTPIRITYPLPKHAARIASFDSKAIATAKGIINRYGGIPRPQDLVSTEQTFFELLGRPASRERVEALRARGFNTVGPVELNLRSAIVPEAR